VIKIDPDSAVMINEPDSVLIINDSVLGKGFYINTLEFINSQHQTLNNLTLNMKYTPILFAGLAILADATRQAVEEKDIKFPGFKGKCKISAVGGELELSCADICSKAKIEFKPSTGSIIRPDKITYHSRSGPTTCPSKNDQEAAIFQFMERNYLEKGLRPSNFRQFQKMNVKERRCDLGYDEEFKTLRVDCAQRICLTFKPLSPDVLKRNFKYDIHNNRDKRIVDFRERTFLQLLMK
jgi:hypothetical protein